MNNTNKDLYDVLKVNRNASESEIKKAYHTLMKIYHPDNNIGREEFAEEIVAEINYAYSVLSDREKRRRYDLDSLMAEDASNDFSCDNDEKTQYNYTQHEKKNGEYTQNKCKSGKNKKSKEFISHIVRIIAVSGFIFMVIVGGYSKWKSKKWNANTNDNFFEASESIKNENSQNKNIKLTNSDAKIVVENYFNSFKENDLASADAYSVDEMKEFNEQVMNLLNIPSSTNLLLYELSKTAREQLDWEINECSLENEKGICKVTIHTIDSFQLLIDIVNSFPIDIVNELSMSEMIKRNKKYTENEEYLNSIRIYIEFDVEIQNDSSFEVKIIDPENEVKHVLGGNLWKISTIVTEDGYLNFNQIHKDYKSKGDQQ